MKKNGIKIRRAIRLLKNTNCCPEKLSPNPFAKANITAKPNAASRPKESGRSIVFKAQLVFILLAKYIIQMVFASYSRILETNYYKLGFRRTVVSSVIKTRSEKGLFEKIFFEK